MPLTIADFSTDRSVFARRSDFINIGTKPVRITPDFNAFAAAHPWVGQKVGKAERVGDGMVQEFQAATAYGLLGGDVFEVHGAIRVKYNQLKGPLGLLGYPTTNETPTPDGKGRFNHFEHGSIYWHPALGAFEVHGAIRAKWVALGSTGFGYPLTDESPTLDGVGRYNHFRLFLPNGGTTDRSIFWSPATGAQDVRDGIRDAWSANGWELGFLGYPVAGEYASGGGLRTDFAHGSIAYSDALGLQVQPQRLVINAPNITFGGGIPVGGYGHLEIFSDGTTHLWGHLHDSGMPPYDCLAVFAFKDADGMSYAATATGTVHGWDPGSRNLDWDDWGMNDDVRKNWAKLWAQSTGGYRIAVTSDWTFERIAKFVGEIAGAAAAVVGLAVAFVALVAGGGTKKSADANYGPPEAYPPGGEPPPEAGIRTVA